MLYIRVDMNDTIATGHMMRCLAIAGAAKELGEDTTFLTADSKGTELILAHGFRQIVLDTPWDTMEAELPKLEEVIRKEEIPCLLIDSYYVTEQYLKAVTELTKTIYLDDINQFPYPVTGILCYTNYWKKFHYKENNQTAKLYLGTEYVPLRKEFENCSPKGIRPQVENLLLLSGGADPYHSFDRLLGRIKKENYQRIDVICGKYNQDYSMLREKYKAYPYIYFHKQVEDMKEYMERADVAVSAGGVTLYELCAVGTPTISFLIADNQLDNVRQFQEDGLIDYAGDMREGEFSDEVANRAARYLETYQEDEKLRRERSLKMQRLVDGKGAKRIAEILKE